jgi:hypothetical protein
VLHVNDRTVRLAPGRQERSNVSLRAGVVPFAPARIVETLLDIDQEQRGVC